MHADTAIIGAGLSGLALADMLATSGRTPVVLEARDRVGGRILSLAGPRAETRYDLGPAWVWPHNRSLRALVARLGLREMPQHATGRLVFEDAQGSVRRDLDFATMGDALRVQGGLAQLPEALAAAVGSAHLRLGHRVMQVDLVDDQVALAGVGPDGTFSMTARQVVFALPPRILAETLSFSPALPPEILAHMRSVPTWMAAHAKVIAIYDRAFWRDRGLSGDAISHRGPLMEIHDASAEPDAKGEAALFGFVHPALAGSISVNGRQEHIVSQLVALFGPEAAAPLAVLTKSWSADRETATELDLSAPAAHPAYGPIPRLQGPWSGRIHFSGTETASRDGGFLEGALIAASDALAALA